jgi:hypothetical protein
MRWRIERETLYISINLKPGLCVGTLHTSEQVSRRAEITHTGSIKYLASEHKVATRQKIKNPAAVNTESRVFYCPSPGRRTIRFPDVSVRSLVRVICPSGLLSWMLPLEE